MPKKSERDIIEKNITDDPLWAAQEIVDHGPRVLIEKLLQTKWTPDEQHWKDGDEARAAHSYGGAPKHQYGLIKIGQREARIPVNALGCCIQKLYVRMRDDDTPIKNGERFVCHPGCSPPFADQWIFNDGSFERVKMKE